MKAVEGFLESKSFKILKRYKAYLELDYFPNENNRFADEIVGEFSLYKSFIISDFVDNKTFYRSIEYFYNNLSSLSLERDLLKTFSTKVIRSKAIEKKYFSVFIDDYSEHIINNYKMSIVYLRPYQIEEVKDLKEVLEGDTLFVAQRKILLKDTDELSGMIEGLIGTLYEYEIKEVFWWLEKW